MINPTRLLERFQEFVAVDNASKNEAALCAKIRETLAALGIASSEDDSAAKIGGTSGNLYAYVEGSRPLAPLLFSAHMDSVAPACGKKAVFHPDGTITSDATTVLGADDLSGVCVILEALTSIRESGAAHRPIELLFDAAEETYCAGIQQFDFSRLRSKEAYIFDLTGPVGSAAYQAPSILSFCAEFHGRAAHAAFSPESGIHAIKAAANAVSSIECGHVADTTVNIGTIRGGSADNVVPEHCIATGEVRSFEAASARQQLSHIQERFAAAAADAGAQMNFRDDTLCLAYKVGTEEPVANRFRAACKQVGLSGHLVSTYVGSDNNHFFHHGLRGLVVASGMNNCHSCGEYTSTAELLRAAELAQALMLSEE